MVDGGYLVLIENGPNKLGGRLRRSWTLDRLTRLCAQLAFSVNAPPTSACSQKPVALT